MTPRERAAKFVADNVPLVSEQARDDLAALLADEFVKVRADERRRCCEMAVKGIEMLSPDRPT